MALFPRREGSAIDVRQLLSQVEGRTLERKRDLSSLAPVLRTLVAFANTSGGTLLVGIEDDGTVVGLDDAPGPRSRRSPRSFCRRRSRARRSPARDADVGDRVADVGNHVADVGDRVAGVYGDVGNRVADVGDRVREPEPHEQEAEVSRFVKARGRITRAEAARLCRLSSQGARHLLERLVRRGTLVLRGRGRGAYYELSSGDSS